MIAKHGPLALVSATAIILKPDVVALWQLGAVLLLLILAAALGAELDQRSA
jgi:hypothetical protein